MSRPQPHVEGVSHRFVQIRPGLRLHVAEAGPPDAPPALLLHGWPQHWYEWRHLIPALAAEHRVLAPDLRGLGWSDAPPDGYDKETLKDDVVGLMDALDVGPVRLVGHDWGGWVGFLLCLFHPERVERYLALNIAHPWQRGDLRTARSAWRFWYQWVLATPGLGPRAAARLAGLGDDGARRLGFDAWSSVERETFLGQFAEPERARASTGIYRSFQLVDLPRTLSGRYRRMRLRTPTLMLYGTEDQVVRPHNVEGFEPYADDMRLEHVPGIGHFIADQAPELVAQRALEHFARAGAPA